MTDKEKRILEMLRNVRNFGLTHDETFAVGSLARELFDNVSNIVDELEGLAAKQSSARAAARQHMTVKSATRGALIKDLTTINKTARAMALTTPGLEDKFRLPHNMSDQLLLDTAGAFLADAQPFKAEFLRREVPTQVFTDLEANVATFQESLARQYAAGESNVAAGASFDAGTERGVNCV